MTDYRKILMLRSKGCSQREMEQMHIPDQQLHMHGILAPLRRSGAPLHERKERDLYNW